MAGYLPDAPDCRKDFGGRGNRDSRRFPCVPNELKNGRKSNAPETCKMQTQRAPTSYRADILRSADILSAVGRGTFCHPSSAKRLAGQHVRHPAARRMHALQHSEPRSVTPWSHSVPPAAVAILPRGRAHLLQEGYAHLLGVGETRQPADVLNWKVGALQEMPGAATTAVVEFGE